MKNGIITSVKGMEVLDSRGNPTVMATVEVDGEISASALVPSGASTGAYEACELRDGSADRYGGKGTLVAAYHISHELDRLLCGRQVTRQRELDMLMREEDGTPEKCRLGANAILGVSLACARAAARLLGQPLYRYLGGINAHVLPCPMMNVLNGGRHAKNGLSFQEFMLMPVGADCFAKAVEWGAAVQRTLGQLLHRAGKSTGVGDEGGFAPELQEEQEAIEWLIRAVEEAGFQMGSQFMLALDPAATELYEAAKQEGKEGMYYFWKSKKWRTPQQMIDLWEQWCRDYPICSVEDALAEEDWEHHRQLTERIGNRVQLVGDDLFVTNPIRLEKGVALGAANAVLVKLNQIGTLSETLDTVELAKKAGWNCVISHRSGDTEDPFIADLAVAVNAGQIKTGALCRSERVSKYNRLLQIERELGAQARQNMMVRA